MLDEGWEKYTMHNHLPAINKIVWELYAHLEALTDNQPMFSRVQEKMVIFTRQNIPKAIPFKAILVEHPLFFKLVAQTPTHWHSGGCMPTSPTVDLTSDISNLAC